MVREALWGAVSHHQSLVDFDFEAYTQIWLDRLAGHVQGRD